jgi:hypothetical protein
MSLSGLCLAIVMAVGIETKNKKPDTFLDRVSMYSKAEA